MHQRPPEHPQLLLGVCPGGREARHKGRGHNRNDLAAAAVGGCHGGTMGSSSLAKWRFIKRLALQNQHLIRYTLEDLRSSWSIELWILLVGHPVEYILGCFVDPFLIALLTSKTLRFIPISEGRFVQFEQIGCYRITSMWYVYLLQTSSNYTICALQCHQWSSADIDLWTTSDWKWCSRWLKQASDHVHPSRMQLVGNRGSTEDLTRYRSLGGLNEKLMILPSTQAYYKTQRSHKWR